MNEDIVESECLAYTIEHPETKLALFEIDVSDGFADRSVAGEFAFHMIQLELDFGDAG